MPHAKLLALCVILSPLLGCAYHFQGASNPLREMGVQKIYVAGFTNRTYRPGIEQLFNTAMIREIRKARAFELVDSAKQADAVLTGEVASTESSPTSTREFSAGNRNLNVAVQYQASVICNINLKDRDGRLIFSQSVSGNKIQPGTAAVGDPGSTAPLYNESEQRLAVQFLASQMMASVYQRMVDTF
jgi:membrane-bound inhibitor of C-type lysozyme